MAGRVRSAGDKSAREYELGQPLITSVELGREEIFLGRRTQPASPHLPVIVLVARRAREDFDEAHDRLLESVQDTGVYVHPNLTGILDVIDNSEGLFVVLEHVSGTDLDAATCVLRERGVNLPFELSAFVCHEVLQAMHHLHTARDARGEPIRMTVRDVSPANVLIGRDGRVKLANRCLAAALERKRRRPAPELFAHFAPECIAGEPFSVASDIYGMGVLLFELILGEICFPGDTKEEVLSQILERGVNSKLLSRVRAPTRLEEAVERATYVVPERRFRSALEMSQSLEQFLREAGPSLELGPKLSQLLTDLGALDPTRTIAGAGAEAASEALPRLTSGRRSAPNAPEMDDAPGGVRTSSSSSSSDLEPSGRMEPLPPRALEAELEPKPPIAHVLAEDDLVEATLVAPRTPPVVDTSAEFGPQDSVSVIHAIAEVVVEARTASRPARDRARLDDHARPRFDTIPDYESEALPDDVPSGSALRARKTNTPTPMRAATSGSEPSSGATVKAEPLAPTRVHTPPRVITVEARALPLSSVLTAVPQGPSGPEPRALTPNLPNESAIPEAVFETGTPSAPTVRAPTLGEPASDPLLRAVATSRASTKATTPLPTPRSTTTAPGTSGDAPPAERVSGPSPQADMIAPADMIARADTPRLDTPPRVDATPSADMSGGRGSGPANAASARDLGLVRPVSPSPRPIGGDSGPLRVALRASTPTSPASDGAGPSSAPPPTAPPEPKPLDPDKDDAIQGPTLLLIVLVGLAILSAIVAFVQQRERTIEALDRAPREIPSIPSPPSPKP